MTTEELVFYIKNQLDAGVDKDSIITTLQSQGGWSIEYITEAFLQIEEANEMAVLVSSVEKPELSQKKQETEQDSVTHKPTNDLLKTQNYHAKFNWVTPLWGVAFFGVIGLVIALAQGGFVPLYIIPGGIIGGMLGLVVAVLIFLKKNKPEFNNKSKINKKLPLFGAIGFGVGASLAGWLMTLSLLSFFARFCKGLLYEGGIGIITGAIGGAALGLALKKKRKIFYSILAGSVGFGVGTIFIYRFSMFFIYSYFFTLVDVVWYILMFFGLAIIGAIGSVALGLALLKNKRKIIYLAFAGAIGTGIGFCPIVLIVLYVLFLIGTEQGGGNILVNMGLLALGGVIGGASLGTALAFLMKDEEENIEQQNPLTSSEQKKLTTQHL